MSSNIPLLLDYCLYFTANALARAITHMAEEEFNVTGISPSHAFLVMRVNENPGLTQKDLSDQLKLAPSTVTRFIDDLERKGYLERMVEGKISRIKLTDTGHQLQSKIDAAWHALYDRYCQVLGVEESYQLSQMIKSAVHKLEG
jgi:DNA-binding MarR family transcriptional regulator